MSQRILRILRRGQLELARTVVMVGLLLFAGWTPLALAIDAPPAAKPPATATKSTGDKPAADKPAEEKSTGDKPAADKPAADKPAADKPAADKSEEDADAEDSKPPPKPSGKSSGSPQRFEPSEQVRPDFDVSFPIDI